MLAASAFRNSHANPSIDPSPLRLPAGRSESGYRGVYRHRHRFVAKWKFHGRLYHLGVCQTAREAAMLVAQAYRDHFGPGWPLLFAGIDQRKRPPFQIHVDGDGYGAKVWIHNRPVKVDGGPWPDQSSAREAAREFRRRLTEGRSSHPLLYRCS